MKFKYFILMIALETLQMNLTVSCQNYEQGNYMEKCSNFDYVNICDLPDRTPKIQCYCENIEIRAATKADCWVLNGRVTEDDPFWCNFDMQPKLENLAFNVRPDGGLAYIPSNIIKKLDHLENLNIQFANIDTISAFAFTNSSTLRVITLTINKIETLDKMSFAHLVMLTKVNLMNNQIYELKRNVFYDLPNLKRLNLSKNIITTIHDGCFKHLNNLIELILSNNLISVLTRETFQGLTNLITLDMKNNQLMMLGDQAFVKLWHLRELYLDNNEIEFISEGGISGLMQLKKLTLANNKLTALHDGLLQDVNMLNVLDLKNNNLETVKQKALGIIIENMKSDYASLSLNGNKLTCDCRLSWIYNLHNETRSKSVRNSLDQLSCIMGNGLKSYFDNIEVKKVNDSSRKDSSPEKDNLGNNGAIKIVEDVYDDSVQNRKTDFDSLNVVYKRILEIPIEMLPCSRKQTFDESYIHIQDQIKYYRGSSNQKIVPNIVILSMFVLINTFYLQQNSNGISFG